MYSEGVEYSVDVFPAELRQRNGCVLLYKVMFE